MKKLILFPFNGNAREAASVIQSINKANQEWDLLGFVDDSPDHNGKEFATYPVLCGRDFIHLHRDAYVLAVPGRPENFRHRASLIQSLHIPQSRFATIIHPTASIGVGTTVGRNTLIMNNVVLTAGVAVGDHVVILPNTVVAHDSRIGDYSLIGSNVSISGGVTIAENCYIGTGSKLIQEVTIGKQALIGLGSVVIDDVPPKTVFAGNPARMIRER